MTGKIIKGIAGFYYVHGEDQVVYECKAKGIFRNRGIKPLVGDNVEFAVLVGEAHEGRIDRILERINTMVRPAVANIDQAMVVTALKDPEPNLNLLDRFLVSMERRSIPVILVFNKLDLIEEEMARPYASVYGQAGYPVLFVSTCDGQGMERLKEYLKGKTTVFAGPSGVGKSSLTNHLYPKAEMETGVVSQRIRRGKHTTRHSELFCVEPGTYLMDTPGFSSVFVEDMEPQELKAYFPEFQVYEEFCRFLGCVHIGEKICGVKQAVKEGRIDDGRYENYRLFYQELKDKRRY